MTNSIPNIFMSESASFEIGADYFVTGEFANETGSTKVFNKYW